MSGLRLWALGLAATVAAVVICYYWLDRPIALFVHAHGYHHHLFRRLTRIPEALAALSFVLFLALAFSALGGRRLSRLPTVLLICATSLAVAVMIKDLLKGAFGRTWPETWSGYYPSFIGDGSYGFHPFHGGGAYESFPSGHAAMACTVMTVLWICYPRFRPLYALCMVAASVGLVGANFHFLSDVIAGSYLGISAGWLGVAVWEMGEHPVRPKEMVNPGETNSAPRTG
jgi:membrane-associated phospholipid phosphatase